MIMLSLCEVLSVAELRLVSLLDILVFPNLNLAEVLVVEVALALVEVVLKRSELVG